MRRAPAGVLLAAAAGLLLGACGQADGPTTTPTQAPSTQSVAPVSPGTDDAPADLGTPEEYAQQVVDETNAARETEGLEPLAPSSCAEEQALPRAEALVADGGELVHAPLAPVSAACEPASRAGENLSRAAASAADVVDAWLGSPGHRSNLLSPEFTELGVACTPMTVDEVDEMLCAQIFLGP
ncbi:CAP domain-containing protein [Sanguibacter suaedae]|uniref:SCP domain-containing protein n=1 Tax=Sanguibacter suaedae TaxID=2795737 RepID=A0A934IAZ9_9MICO|nr:CAP domain-containing protein [Sanguibacter suaedae]MBI9114623.1 hypothetical protein [Sanguibacter suaedae]